MSCKFAPSNKIMKKYRVKEENDKFSIEVEKITKNIFGKENRFPSSYPEHNAGKRHLRRAHS